MTGQSGQALYIGTSGWSYNHWKGVLYPLNLAPDRMLEQYAVQFRSTEINSSFYRLPDRRTLEKWRNQTPADFVFSVKASRYITHMKKLKEVEASISKLLSLVSLLGDKLGPILFQLPPRWTCNEERFSSFLEILPAGFRYTFEFRDKSWLNSRVYGLLTRFNAAFCIYELNGFLAPKEVTADFVYVRLHGPDGPYRGSYSRTTLAAWAGMFMYWSNQGRDIYCFFDNDENGYAATNASELQNMLTGIEQNQR